MLGHACLLLILDSICPGYFPFVLIQSLFSLLIFVSNDLMGMCCLFFLGVCQLMCLGALVMMPAPPSSSRNCHIDNCYFIHLLIFIPFLIISKDTTVHCRLWWPCMLIGFCKFIDRDVLRKKNYTLVSWAKHVSITIIYLCYA